MKRLSPAARLHLRVILGILLGTSCWPIAYYFGDAADYPLWLKIALPVGCAVALYVWFLQGLSEDGTTSRPRLW